MVLPQDEDSLFFLPEEETKPESPKDFWDVLIIDDEQSVHDVTVFALKGHVYDGRVLRFHSVYSSAEAIRFLQSGQTPVQAILLDIVMETRRAGLEVVDFLRNTLNDHQIQIVVRTGNPGLAPEDYLVHHYEINDYREKTELTVQRLKTALITALRAHANIRAIHRVVEAKLEALQAGPAADHRSPYLVPQGTKGLGEGQGLISLPFFLGQTHPQEGFPQATAEPNAAPPLALTFPFVQGKVAAISRKAIAIFDYTVGHYTYVSDNIEEVTGLGLDTLKHWIQKGKMFSPDMKKIDKINKQLRKTYLEAPSAEQAKFVAIFDYRLTPSPPQNVRMLEYVTPLLLGENGSLLLSMHLFSNINHLKKTDAHSVLALHHGPVPQYFSISDYRIDEIFFGPREEEIVKYSNKNMSSREIAKEINLSVHTVDTHLRNLRDRLGVTSTNALISYCKEIATFL